MTSRGVIYERGVILTLTFLHTSYEHTGVPHTSCLHVLSMENKNVLRILRDYVNVHSLASTVFVE